MKREREVKEICRGMAALRETWPRNQIMKKTIKANKRNRTVVSQKRVGKAKV